MKRRVDAAMQRHRPSLVHQRRGACAGTVWTFVGGYSSLKYLNLVKGPELARAFRIVMQGIEAGQYNGRLAQVKCDIMILWYSK